MAMVKTKEQKRKKLRAALAALENDIDSESALDSDSDSDSDSGESGEESEDAALAPRARARDATQPLAPASSPRASPGSGRSRLYSTTKLADLKQTTSPSSDGSSSPRSVRRAAKRPRAPAPAPPSPPVLALGATSYSKVGARYAYHGEANARSRASPSAPRSPALYLSLHSQPTPEAMHSAHRWSACSTPSTARARCVARAFSATLRCEGRSTQ